MAKACRKCGDTGMYLGNGFMLMDCDLCSSESDGDKKTPTEKGTIPIEKLDKRSASYQNAIKEIMSSCPGTSRSEAVKMFNESYAKA
jgi:hypothetical protein